MNKAVSKRVFLALWPNESDRDQLHQFQQHFASHPSLREAKAVARQNLHLTLHFLGSIELSIVDELVSQLDQLKAPCFDLVLDQTGCFRRAQISWLGCSKMPADLESLYQRSGHCVSQCLKDYQARSFVPHVSLFRKSGQVPELADLQPMIWHVDRYALVESDTRQEGVHYEVVKQWLLS